MEKNKEILINWEKEIKQYKMLSFKQSQELYKRIIECDNKEIKKTLRNKLITGTFYIIYELINNNEFIYMNSPSYNMDDIINSTIETWIKKLDSGEILEVENFKQLINHEFYNNIIENMGIKIDIPTSEYLNSAKEFIDLIVDYINKKQEMPDFDYIKLVEYMKENPNYYKLLKKVNNAYYELKQYEDGKIKRNKYQESLLKKQIDKQDMSTFELFDAIIKSLETENPTLQKTKLYNIRFLVLNNGIEYKRTNIDNLVINNIEEQYEKKELRQTIINMIKNCKGVTYYHKELILERFGFKGEPMTLEEFVEIYGGNNEYARQAQARILRKLKAPSKSKKLKKYL